MRVALLAALCVALSVAPAGATAPWVPTVDAFVAAINANNIGAIPKLCTGNPAIVDNFPPFAWHDCSRWIGDFELVVKQNQVKNIKVKLGDARVMEVTLTHAYVVFPVVYSSTMKGKPYVEKGLWAFALVSNAGNWRISGLGFSQTDPHG